MTENAQDADRKLAELMLYIARKSEGDPAFGATKLNKILFYSDFSAFGQTGSSITGQEYQKLPYGPAPRRLIPVQRDMEADRSAAVQEVSYFGERQRRLVALRDPDLSGFSGAHIAIVDEVIKRLALMSATEVSDLSHEFVGWRTCREGQTIPYETVFVSTRPPTQEERAFARGIGPGPSGQIKAVTYHKQ